MPKNKNLAQKIHEEEDENKNEGTMERIMLFGKLMGEEREKDMGELKMPKLSRRNTECHMKNE